MSLNQAPDNNTHNAQESIEQFSFMVYQSCTKTLWQICFGSSTTENQFEVSKHKEGTPDHAVDLWENSRISSASDGPKNMEHKSSAPTVTVEH